MILQALAFYVFAAVTVASAAMVVVSRNPVYSVLFLILAFFNAAGLFLLIGAEFIAMILVIVYVGAVAVLFLFVVMMLDINLTELREGFLAYFPVGALIGAGFALLYAPDRGSNTRRKLGRKIRHLRDRSGESVSELKDKLRKELRRVKRA